VSKPVPLSPWPPICCRCLTRLNAPGGLAFAPPLQTIAGEVCVKLHVCADCWPDLERFLATAPPRKTGGRR